MSLRCCFQLLNEFVTSVGHGDITCFDRAISIGVILDTTVSDLCHWLYLRLGWITPFLQSAFASQQWGVSSITTLIISARASSSILNSFILSKRAWASIQEKVVAITARWNMMGWTYPFRVGLLATLLGWTIVLILTQVYLSLIHIWRCRRSYACRSRWSPYH